VCGVRVNSSFGDPDPELFAFAESELDPKKFSQTQYKTFWARMLLLRLKRQDFVKTIF